MGGRGGRKCEDTHMWAEQRDMCGMKTGREKQSEGKTLEKCCTLQYLSKREGDEFPTFSNVSIERASISLAEEGCGNEAENRVDRISLLLLRFCRHEEPIIMGKGRKKKEATQVIFTKIRGAAPKKQGEKGTGS